jgi:cell division protein FtsB
MSRGLLRILTLASAFAVVVLLFNVVAGPHGLSRRIQSDRELAEVHRRIAEIETGNARLQREVSQLRNDETIVRRAIAEELLLVPPGSTVYRFPQ